jgi:hypothetical protein
MGKVMAALDANLTLHRIMHRHGSTVPIHERSDDKRVQVPFLSLVSVKDTRFELIRDIGSVVLYHESGFVFLRVDMNMHFCR